MRTKITILALLLLCPQLFAQGVAERYKANYDRQVRYVGAAGAGVETIIDRWTAECPDDPEAYAARFSYCFAKARSTGIVQKDGARYLGAKPVLSLKDSLGMDVNYFEASTFSDSLFAGGIRAIDKAISLSPKEFRYHFYKISALMDYEKESPDLAAGEIDALIGEYTEDRDGWTLDSAVADEDIFLQAVGEYCYTLFQTGSPLSYEYFREISERMSRLYPRNTVFIDNLGSYWQVAKKNERKALKYYKKALKIDPEDYAATKNISLMERSRKKK